MVKNTMQLFRATSVVLAAVVLLAGCSTTAVKHQPKAKYSEFTDVTWRPETSIRPPHRSNELPIDPLAVLQEGVHAFYDTDRSFLQLKPDQNGTWAVSETFEASGQRCFTWSRGAAQIIRNSRVMPNEGRLQASLLPDGRILLHNSGKAEFNLAVELRAYDVSGKPIRHFLRNGNNQPDSLAWFIPAEAKFPKGSVAYLATYWLGDDEIVMPSQSAFTGSRSLENLLSRYTLKSPPYCISYVSHLEATPYGLSFEAPVRSRKAKRKTAAVSEGRFTLKPVQRSNMFCERLPEGEQKGGTWKITHIQGTRVLELHENADVDCADMGIQPINNAGVDIGFAEIMRGNKGNARLQVVPIRIIRNNQPVTDFRLKFNGSAAQAIADVLPAAEASRLAYQQEEKAD